MKDSRTALGWRSIQISWRAVGVGAAEDLLGERAPDLARLPQHPALLGLGGRVGGGAGDRGGRGQDRAFGLGRHGPPRVLGAAEGPVVRGAERVEHAVEHGVGVRRARSARARAPRRPAARGPPTRSCRTALSSSASGSRRRAPGSGSGSGSTATGSGAGSRAASGLRRPNRRAQKPRFGRGSGSAGSGSAPSARRARLLGSRGSGSGTTGRFGSATATASGSAGSSASGSGSAAGSGVSTVSTTRVPHPEGSSRTVPLARSASHSTRDSGSTLRDPDLPELAQMAGQRAEIGQLGPQLGGRLDEGAGSLERTHGGSFRHASDPSSRRRERVCSPGRSGSAGAPRSSVSDTVRAVAALQAQDAAAAALGIRARRAGSTLADVDARPLRGALGGPHVGACAARCT